MEKYGFVYIWFDRKHKRYYVGAHWGTENDGYICSSTWMMNSYKRRPHDFKKLNGSLNRRILARVYTNKKDLFLEEYKWLSLIKKEELRIRYYNLKIYHVPVDEKKRETALKKMKITMRERYVGNTTYSQIRSEQTKEYYKSTEARERNKQTQKEVFSTPEMKIKMSEVRKKQWANTEFKVMMSEERKQRWENPEYRKKMAPGRDIERRREYMREYMRTRRSKGL